MSARKLAGRLAAMVNRLVPWAPRPERRASVRQAAQARQRAERARDEALRAQREIERLTALTGNRIADRLAGEIRAGRHLRPGQQ